MSKPSWIGKTLAGRYKIDQLLGQGGMSAVYKATDPNLRRVVAVKLIHTHLSDRPEFVRRFEEEAAAVAQLRHPNIIQVYDFNHDNDVYFIVFEFVPGESLHERLKRLQDSGRNMPLNDVLKAGIQVGEALGYAHKRNLIHRDIKPANVMLNVQGDAILMDFGIVKIVGGEQHTATGAVLGTARYMPPEQIRGERIDERADIYSFGVMLFEMVTGRVPYEADSAMTMMMMHMNDPVPDPASLREDVSPDLTAIIRRAMAKQQAERYQSIDELVADLRSIQGGSTVAAATTAAPAGGATVLEKPDAQAAPERTFVETASTPSAAAGATYVESVPGATGAGTPPAAATAGTGVGRTGPTPPVTEQAKAGGGRNRALAMGCGALFLVGLCLAVLGVVFGDSIMSAAGLGGSEEEGTPVVDVEDEATADPEVAATATNASDEDIDEAPTATVAAVVDEPTATTGPTATATLAAGPDVVIDSITVADGQYVVEFTTVGYEPAVNGMHMHFFFDTVPVEEAGVPGAGNWFVWGDPSPFDGYAVTDTPENASDMCVIVANQDHTVVEGTGNCVALPAPAATPTAPANTPTPAAPAATSTPAGPTVSITNITVQNDVLIVPYTTTGYTPALPGMHVHFFFNTVTPDQAGVPGTGNWFVWGGPSPFNGYTVNDIPNGATQLCALVANADHSIILGSGNCFSLP